MTRGRWWARAAVVTVVGAGVGAAGTTLALPLLRRVDPLGLSPVVLISLAGGFALGWYIRGRADGAGISSKSP